MPREDIYGRLFKPYVAKPQYINEKGQISLHAFNNYTLQQLLSFSKNFSRIMNHEIVLLKKQTTTTHNIYTFYEDKKKTKTYALTIQGKFIDNLKGEQNKHDPYIYRIALLEKILEFKKKYTSISDWNLTTNNQKVRLELNTATLEKYLHFKSPFASYRIKQKDFEQIKNQPFNEHKPRYQYQHFIDEIRFKPETINKSNQILSKQFGIDERTIRRWKIKLKADMTL